MTELQTKDGLIKTNTNANIRVGIDKEAVRGNGRRQGSDKLQRINAIGYDSPDSNNSGGGRDQNGETPVVMQLGSGKGGGFPDDDDDDRSGNPREPRI